MALEHFASKHQGKIFFDCEDDYVLAQKLVSAGFSLEIFTLSCDSFDQPFDQVEFMIANGCRFDFNCMSMVKMEPARIIDYVNLYESCNPGNFDERKWRQLVDLALEHCHHSNFANLFGFVLEKKQSDHTFALRQARKAFGEVDIYYFELILDSIRTQSSERSIFKNVYLGYVHTHNFSDILPFFDLIRFDKLMKKKLEFYSEIYEINSGELCDYLMTKGIDIYKPPEDILNTLRLPKPEFAQFLYDRGLILHQMLHLEPFLFSAFVNANGNIIDMCADVVKILIDNGCSVKTIHEILHLREITTRNSMNYYDIHKRLCNTCEAYRSYHNANDIDD
jgi:hypothetical protein